MSQLKSGSLAYASLESGLLMPLGLLLGMPFPLGLGIVAEKSASLVPWCWGANGFFSVIGSMVALITAITLGFKAVLVTGTVSYACALGVVAIAANLRPPVSPRQFAASENVAETENCGDNSNYKYQ